MATPNLASYTTEEKTALLTAVKKEILRRAGGGSVSSGASSGQTFTVMKMSEEGLNSLLEELTIELGYDSGVTQVRPNFSGVRACWPY